MTSSQMHCTTVWCCLLLSQAVARPLELSERMITLACAISIDYGAFTLLPNACNTSICCNIRYNTLQNLRM